MAIANSDGSVVIGVKLSTRSLERGIQNIKNKFAELKNQKLTFEILARSIRISEGALADMNREYAELIARGGENTKRAEQLRATIKGTTQRISELRSASEILGKKATKSFDDMSKGLKKFGKRIAGIVKSALIFSVLYKVMQAVVKLFQNILMSDEEFRQDWEELKPAFYAAAYPIINLIVPAIKYIVQQVRDWAVSIGRVAAALQGMSYSELVEQAKASKEAADNYSDMEKSSKKTADNVKKQLASFDDIQILSSGNKEEQGAGLAGFESLGQYDTSGAKSMIGDVMNAIGGALMALGLILLFHGQIAWGIGFIIAGAFGIAAATLTDESVSQKAKDELSNAMLIVGVVAIVLGILLCMAQQWGLGIGLLVLGVSSIVAPIALNWNGIKEQLQTSFGGWLVLGGVIAIILGILLCFTPMLPLGIGLIVLGVGAVVAPIVANWDAITERLHNFFTENAGLITGASIGLIILGILLCFTPMIGLGIGLIVAGAAGLAGVVAVNWNAIVDWVKGAWEAVKGFWNKYIAPVFTAKFWLDLAKTCGNGLIAGFEGAINGIIWMFESLINLVVSGLNLFVKGINKVVGAAGKLIGVKLKIAEIPKANLGRVSIPRLAEGAVIPPNREFLAVLGDQKQGTNIETPLSTMVEAFQIALDSRGGYSGGNTEVVLEIDGREFGRAVVEQGNRENRRIGTRLVIA